MYSGYNSLCKYLHLSCGLSSLSSLCPLKHKVTLSIFPVLLFVLLVSYLETIANPRLQRLIQVFSSKSFRVLAHIFRSLIHLELVLMYAIRKGSNFILLYGAMPLP